MTTDPLRNESVDRWSPCANALELVNGNRQSDYGHPRDNHEATAVMWTIYLRRAGLLKDKESLSARDVCWLNTLQKASRDANRPKQDNVDDVCGYMENIAMAER